MQTLALIWGILAGLGMLIAFFPCLGWLNWLHIPFSIVGLIVGIAAFATAREGSKNPSIAGIVLCAIAIVFGLLRLAVGGGIF